MANQLAPKNKDNQNASISSFLTAENTQNYLSKVLGGKKEQFVTNLVSLVNQNPKLAECTNASLMSAAIVATSLNLSMNTNFGYAYPVPYKNNKKGVMEAQFQIGYKGYIQLAMRTGQYKKLNAVPIYENQFISWNEVYEDLQLNNVSGIGKIVGYVAYFQLINGFEKLMYWDYSKMMKHADTYSKAFNEKSYHDLLEGKIKQDDMWKYSSFWYKNFNDMACKTMLRQLLSKFGVLSETMERALTMDQAVITEDNKPIYIDNSDSEITPEINENVEDVIDNEQPQENENVLNNKAPF